MIQLPNFFFQNRTFFESVQIPSKWFFPSEPQSESLGLKGEETFEFSRSLYPPPYVGSRYAHVNIPMSNFTILFFQPNLLSQIDQTTVQTIIKFLSQNQPLWFYTEPFGLRHTKSQFPLLYVTMSAFPSGSIFSRRSIRFAGAAVAGGAWHSIECTLTSHRCASLSLSSLLSVLHSVDAKTS